MPRTARAKAAVPGKQPGSRGRPTRVLVVDDHTAIAEALGMAINLQDDLECVAIASTVAEATTLVAERAPDVVLMDVRLPDADGIEGTGRVKALRPEARVVILTAHANLELMARAASAGACGFLPKTSSVAQILEAVRIAGKGGMLVEHSTLTALVQRLRESEPSPDGDGARAERLTPRELEVLILMGQGMDPKAIAKRLVISLYTSRGHVRSILGKLGVHSQLEAVVTAVRRGLIPAPSAS